MKITEKKLRQLVREELVRFDEMGHEGHKGKRSGFSRLASLLPGIAREEYAGDPTYVAIETAAKDAKRNDVPLAAAIDAVKHAYGKGPS